MVTEGAGDEMVLPALAVGAGALSGIYTVGQAYDNYRYWADYYRNTGYHPRYPFRAGQYDFLKNAAQSMYFTYGSYRSLNGFRVPKNFRGTRYKYYGHGLAVRLPMYK